MSKIKRVLQTCRELANEKWVVGVHVSGDDSAPRLARVEIGIDFARWLVEESLRNRANKKREKARLFQATVYLDNTPEYAMAIDDDNYLDRVCDAEGPEPWPAGLNIDDDEQRHESWSRLFVDNDGFWWEAGWDYCDFETDMIKIAEVKTFFGFRVRGGRVIK